MSVVVNEFEVVPAPRRRPALRTGRRRRPRTHGAGPVGRAPTWTAGQRRLAERAARLEAH